MSEELIVKSGLDFKVHSKKSINRFEELVVIFYFFEEAMAPFDSEPIFPPTDNFFNCFNGSETERLAVKSSGT